LVRRWFGRNGFRRHESGCPDQCNSADVPRPSLIVVVVAVIVVVIAYRHDIDYRFDHDNDNERPRNFRNTGLDPGTTAARRRSHCQGARFAGYFP